MNKDKKELKELNENEIEEISGGSENDIITSIPTEILEPRPQWGDTNCYELVKMIKNGEINKIQPLHVEIEYKEEPERRELSE